MSSTPIQWLVTHNGQFHTDEVMSSVILSTLYPNAKIVRTRDKSLIEANDPDTIVYDVGGTFDPANQHFDHHQQGAPKREDGSSYSSFGLIWEAYGMEFLRAKGVPEEYRMGVWRSIERRIVLPVDLADNGELEPVKEGSGLQLERYVSINAIVGAYNPVTSEATAEERMEKFKRAMQVCDDFVDGIINEVLYRFQCRKRLEKLIDEQRDSHILEMDFNAPFEGTIKNKDANQVLLVIHPCDSGYMIKGLRLNSANYDLILDLPEEWAGLSGSELDAVTGVPGGVFCHLKRFMAIHSTLEGARALADLALENAAKITWEETDPGWWNSADGLFEIEMRESDAFAVLVDLKEKEDLGSFQTREEALKTAVALKTRMLKLGIYAEETVEPSA